MKQGVAISTFIYLTVKVDREEEKTKMRIMYRDMKIDSYVIIQTLLIEPSEAVQQTITTDGAR